MWQRVDLAWGELITGAISGVLEHIPDGLDPVLPLGAHIAAFLALCAKLKPKNVMGHPGPRRRAALAREDAIRAKLSPTELPALETALATSQQSSRGASTWGHKRPRTCLGRGAQQQLSMDQQQLQGAQHLLALDQQQLQGAHCRVPIADGVAPMWSETACACVRHMGSKPQQCMCHGASTLSSIPMFGRVTLASDKKEDAECLRLLHARAPHIASAHMTLNVQLLKEYARECLGWKGKRLTQKKPLLRADILEHLRWEQEMEEDQLAEVGVDEADEM
ncbi:hypothetical protein QJQ45_022428 [Haematococcus lacustris]|nr:hypothetical protein QJQ45_022428 [Haematococcus lacustris]